MRYLGLLVFVGLVGCSNEVKDLTIDTDSLVNDADTDTDTDTTTSTTDSGTTGGTPGGTTGGTTGGSTTGGSG